jgi:phosphotriesterase-related protein
MGYSKSKLVGKVQTVLGPISPDKMGATLCHEHCLVDLTCTYNEPMDEVGKKYAVGPVSFSNMGYLRYHVLDNRDNLLMLDETLAIQELLQFKHAGGGTIVDCTNVDLGRNPPALKRISQATGLNIIMGSGYYVKAGQRLDVMEKRTEEDIAKEITQNLFEGVDGTGICSGFIGEIGCSWPLEDCEVKVLRAAGMAQKETGAPLVVHPGRHEDAPFQLAKILKEVGADLSHTEFSHTDRTVFQPKNRYRLLEAGLYLAYDEWGTEGYYPESLSITDVLNDAQRIAQIKDFFARGFGGQVLVSHDICYKCRYSSYGGHGYAHLLQNAVPAMRRRGMSEEQIGALFKGNPGRFYSYR